MHKHGVCVMKAFYTAVKGHGELKEHYDQELEASFMKWASHLFGKHLITHCFNLINSETMAELMTFNSVELIKSKNGCDVLSQYI
jgi:hypothetical protein